MTLTIRLDTTSWSSPSRSTAACTEPPSIMSGPGLLSFNLLRVWVSRVQGPGQPRPHDEMRCAAALHSDTALWETIYRYLHSIYTVISTNQTAFPSCPTTLEPLRPLESSRQLYKQVVCIFPACSVQCDHVTAPPAPAGESAEFNQENY